MKSDVFYKLKAGEPVRLESVKEIPDGPGLWEDDEIYIRIDRFIIDTADTAESVAKLAGDLYDAGRVQPGNYTTVYGRKIGVVRIGIYELGLLLDIMKANCPDFGVGFEVYGRDIFPVCDTGPDNIRDCYALAGRRMTFEEFAEFTARRSLL